MNTLLSSLEQALDVAIDAAKSGGRTLLRYYKDGSYLQRAKADTSFQTTADLESERIILERICQTFPDHAIFSEECGHLSSTSSVYQWVIDPLDGTENFLLGMPYFSSSITLCEHNIPLIAVVYNPLTEELYKAVRGKGAWLNDVRLHVSKTSHLRESRAFFIPDFRTKHQRKTVHLRNQLYTSCRRVLDTWSPALDWCLVASGKGDLLVVMAGDPLQPDAGMLLVEEAGGKITNFNGTPFSQQMTGYLVASNDTLLHERLLQLVKDYDIHASEEQRFD
ncbi:MAG: inositol monophosphatase [Ktedonobacteraceae bacterium]|nr:inositol monophosphatase [Ktedonobacteraceae bacterium]